MIAVHAPAPPLDRLPERAAGGETLLCWDRGETVDGVLPVGAPAALGGWAYSAHDVIEVWAVVDGTKWIQALHRQWRPDVVAPLGTRDAASSGWTIVLSPEDAPIGAHDVTIVALDGRGEAFSVSGRIDVVDRRAGGPGAEPSVPLPTPGEPLDGNGERYVPEAHSGAIEAEHQARYRWACTIAEGRTALDAGCGVGWGTALLLDAGAAAVTGLDISDPALDSARERTAGRATLVRGDLLRMPFADASFDLVTCFEAIEHVEEPERVLDELRRVVRPEGVVLVSSPNRGVYPDGNPHHLHELTSAELEEAMRARFAHVTSYRQQTYLASLLTGDEEFAVADAATPLSAQLRKTRGGAPGEELYTIVAASDRPLPEPAGFAVLADEADYKGWVETTLALERRAALAEAEANTANAQIGLLTFEHDKVAAALQHVDGARRAAQERADALEAEAAALRAELDAARHWLAAIQRSPSWRLTAPLRRLKRRIGG